MSFRTYNTFHLVKSEDLNHHGTLFAGRSAEWFVESGFICAAALTKPENIVCAKIHGMTFSRPVKRGEIICFQSEIVLTGRTRLVAHIDMRGNQCQDTIVEGFITFVHVDQDGRPIPHNVTVTAETEDEISLQTHARELNRPGK